MEGMNAIERIFKRRRVLLPVVHAHVERQTWTAIEVAQTGGADGVFLISHGGMTHDELLAIAERVNRAVWCGVNLLGASPADAVLAVVDRGIPALWMDDVGVEPEAPKETRRRLEHLTELRRALWPQGLVFGGVAFKHQRPVPREHFGTVSMIAAQHRIDVVTTSGIRTGVAPDVDKCLLMRMAINDHPLAVASGITPENVGAFLPYVDAYLVATGIEREDGVFDPARIKALADAVHAP